MAKKRKGGGRVTPKGGNRVQAHEAFQQILLAADEELEGVDDPIDAEVIASALIASWREAIWNEDPDLDPDEAVGLGLILQATRARLPNMLLFLKAMAAVAPARLADAARTAAFSRDAKDQTQRRPEWLDRLGNVTAVGAWSVRDRWEDVDVVGIAFSYGDGGPVHSINVMAEVALGGAAADGFISGDLPDVLTAYPSEDGWVSDEIAIGDAARRIDQALTRADDTGVPPEQDLFDAISLIDARLETLAEELAEHEVSAIEEDHTAAVAEAMAHVAGFLSSPEGAGYLEDERAQQLAADLFVFRSRFGASDPLAISPGLIEHVFFDRVPDDEADGEGGRAAVEVLSAVAAYAGRLRGISDTMRADLERARASLLDLANLGAPAEAADSGDEGGPEDGRSG